MPGGRVQMKILVAVKSLLLSKEPDSVQSNGECGAYGRFLDVHSVGGGLGEVHEEVFIVFHEIIFKHFDLNHLHVAQVETCDCNASCIIIVIIPSKGTVVHRSFPSTAAEQVLERPNAHLCGDSRAKAQLATSDSIVIPSNCRAIAGGVVYSYSCVLCLSRPAELVVFMTQVMHAIMVRKASLSGSNDVPIAVIRLDKTPDAASCAFG